MSLTAPPPVLDPVPCEVDDAVIREARRRARRRRWSYGGVVVALAAVVAFAAWGPTPPVQGPPTTGGGGGGALVPGGAGRDADDPTALRVGFVGLPPEGAVPSSPPTGTLVFSVQTAPVRIWGYADGRMISYRNGAAAMPEAANPAFSGFLEQQLTPEGIEMLRSYLLDNATFGPPTDSQEGAWSYAFPHTVRMADGQFVSAAVRGCSWFSGCPRFTDPEAWLPASAWTDQWYRAYVPTEFRICYDRSDGQPVTVDQVRDALPPEAATRLLAHRTLDYSPRECAVVRTEDARTIDRSFQLAEFQQPEVTELYMLRYVPPTDAGQSESMGATVIFQPVLPHGYATCTSCG